MLKRNAIYNSASRQWRKVPVRIREPIWRFVQSWSGEDYQRIAFHGKVYRRGTNRAKSYRQLFPQPPRDAKILDVGANLGYYSLRAIEEGAAYCRAVDIEADNVAFIRTVADDLKIDNLDVVKADIARYPVERDFDVILCLNVLHHFPDLEAAETIIEKLYRRASSKLVLMVLAPDEAGVRHSFDTDPDPLGGKRFLRISPHHVSDLYRRVKVEIAPAKSYGPNRYVIIIHK